MKIGKIKFSICTFQFAISNIIALQLGAPWRHRRIALEAQAHRSGGTGASPVLATHAYQARAGASIDA